jgi:hypothetical protein
MRYDSKQIVYSIIGVISIAIVIQFLQRPNEETVCDKFRLFSNSEINGAVKTKFKDPNDHYKPVVIYYDSGREDRLDLSLDFSGLYEVLKAGDSIAKKSNSSRVFVNRKSVFEVNFGYDCE